MSDNEVKFIEYEILSLYSKDKVVYNAVSQRVQKYLRENYISDEPGIIKKIVHKFTKEILFDISTIYKKIHDDRVKADLNMHNNSLTPPPVVVYIQNGNSPSLN